MPTVYYLGMFLWSKSINSRPYKKPLAFLGFGFCLGFCLLITGGRAQAVVANHLVINEIAIDSLVGTGGTEDDWLELYNPTSQAVVLDSWSIQKASAAGDSFTRQALAGTIPAGAHFLIVKNDPATSQTLKDAADLLVAASFDLVANNTVFLVNDNVTITGATDSNIVDYVGYGTASLYEGASALGIDEAKSIARVPEGNDTNNNLNDFNLLDTPTPQNSRAQTGGSSLSGQVLLTITPNVVPVQNISPTSVDLVFQANAASNAKIIYGLTGSYGSSTAASAVLENTNKTISLTGLNCNKTYHYQIYAENAGATQTDLSDDATFTTLPCGLTLNSLTMTRQSAKANNKYLDGWEWQFDLTVWNLAETHLKMKFDQWTGLASLPAAANMQFSVDNGQTWQAITGNNSYSAAIDLTGIDNSSATGRQIKILVQMKVPTGTQVGSYSSNYGILTE